jgi:hypothetical protein
VNWVVCHQLLQLGGSIVFVEKIFKRVQLLSYGVVNAYSSLRLLCEGMLQQRELPLASRQAPMAVPFSLRKRGDPSVPSQEIGSAGVAGTLPQETHSCDATYCPQRWCGTRKKLFFDVLSYAESTSWSNSRVRTFLAYYCAYGIIISKNACDSQLQYSLSIRSCILFLAFFLVVIPAFAFLSI